MRSAYFFLISLILFTSVWARELEEESSFPLHSLSSFTLGQLQQLLLQKSPQANPMYASLQSAVLNTGLFALELAADSPADSLPSPLGTFAGCVRALTRSDDDSTDSGNGGMPPSSLFQEVVLRDGTRRLTFATSTNLSLPMPLPSSLKASCPEFATAASKLRITVDHAGQVYAQVLDLLVHGVPPTGVVDSSKADSFASAVLRAESLEHFHIFHRYQSPSATFVDSNNSEGSNEASGPSTSGKKSAEKTLEMHTDMGLFIIMTPAEYHSLGNSPEGARVGSNPEVVKQGGGEEEDSTGFRLRLPSGKVVIPTFPPGSLLVMNGEGSNLWMRRATPSPSRRPYAPDHEVLVPRLAGRGRVWFGRMFLPPRDAVLQQPMPLVDGNSGIHSSLSNPSGSLPLITFNDYREQAFAAFRDGMPHLASSAGCSTGPSRRILVDEGSCKTDEVYCWMSCMKFNPSLLTCSQDAVLCANPQGQLWPQDFPPPGIHCMNCKLTCPEGQSPPPPSSLPPPPSSLPPPPPSSLPPPPSSTIPASPPPLPSASPPASPPLSPPSFSEWDGKPLTMGVLLYSKYELLDVMGPLQFISYWDFVRVSFVTKRGKNVKATQNISSVARYSYTNAPRFDILFVPGGTGSFEAVDDPETIEFVQRASARAKFTWSVCTGAWILAKAGLLDGRNATSNKFYWDYTSVYGPKVNWKSSARWVVDGKYWTSSGVSAGMDMSLGFARDYFGGLHYMAAYLFAEYTPNLDPNNDPYAVGGDINKSMKEMMGMRRRM